MAGQRNRITKLTEYIKNCGVELHIGKTKALGNKGFFKAKKNCYRIDIAKNLSEEAVLSTMTHEFAHYIHYCYDKSLNSLSFLFDDISEYENELLQITVDLIPKSFAKELFDKKEQLKSEKRSLQSKLTLLFPNYDSKKIEDKIKKTNLKYLLKHDRVRVIENFNEQWYSIDSLESNSDIELYLKIKSKQRNINRINSKISSLNRYYNSPTELFARSFELFINDAEKLNKLAPNIGKYYHEIIASEKLPMMTNYFKIYNEKY